MNDQVYSNGYVSSHMSPYDGPPPLPRGAPPLAPPLPLLERVPYKRAASPCPFDGNSKKSCMNGEILDDNSIDAMLDGN